MAGTSGKVVLDSTAEDDGVAQESYGIAIIQALGMERRNQVCGVMLTCGVVCILSVMGDGVA